MCSCMCLAESAGSFALFWSRRFDIERAMEIRVGVGSSTGDGQLVTSLMGSELREFRRKQRVVGGGRGAHGMFRGIVF